MGAQGEYEFVQQITVDKPNLWSTSNPYLYTVRSNVHEAGQVMDVYETPFGIREAIFDAKRGFLLNGEHIKLNGVCLHQEAGCVGSAVPEAHVGAAAGAAAGDGLQRDPDQPQSATRLSFSTCATAWASW